MTEVRIAAKAIIRDKNKNWLLIRDHGYLTLPGGGVEVGETLEDALKRELEEELGLTRYFSAEEVYRLPYAPRHDSSKQHLWVVFHVVIEGGFAIPENSPPDLFKYMPPSVFAGKRGANPERIYQCYRGTGL